MKKFGLTFLPALFLFATVVLSFAPLRADAAVFSFSFTSDGPPDILGNTPGTVTGLIFGLNENGIGQQATSLEILSSPIGFSGTMLPYLFGTIDISNGVVTGVSGLAFEHHTISPSTTLHVVFDFPVGNGNGDNS